MNILGIPMVIRIHGRDTGGVVSAVESHDVPGGGPPPHIHHREDETFQILEGEYEWTVGGKTFIAQKGATIFAPRGIPHTYRYLGKTPGRLMCVITPAGFEGFFEEIGALSGRYEITFTIHYISAMLLWHGNGPVFESSLSQIATAFG